MHDLLKPQVVREGDTKILVFKDKVSEKGPGSKHSLPFYNPSMELNRDLSVLIVQWLANTCEKKLEILDGLGASGIRGIRFAKEISGDFFVTINDWSEEAYKLIKKNIQTNGFENVIASNENLNLLLSKKSYHYIDVDPFGSPAYFADSALRSIKNNGIISFTATDTATLCGVYPKVCLRRYGSASFHSYLMKEIGIRILLAFISREATKYDKGISPILSYATDHYFRIYVQVRNGVEHANDSVRKLSLVNSSQFYVNAENILVGPLWMGKLENKRIIENIRSILTDKKMGTKNTLWKLLDLLEEESEAPAFFYNSDDIASRLNLSPPKMKVIFNQLKKKGYNVYRTHFSPTGFKTDAPLNKIEKAFKSN
ncbi:MAG: tRNA (guanine(10)-N(2))-dimethyltransferase [Candidatus Thermoplasmatota archaeon]|nr:tRNA (guanine(10)-N(2))-dimethyltransferase [Candidatus Thermoplasmatota archaeon]